MVDGSVRGRATVLHAPQRRWRPCFADVVGAPQLAQKPLDRCHNPKPRAVPSNAAASGEGRSFVSLPNTDGAPRGDRSSVHTLSPNAGGSSRCDSSSSQYAAAPSTDPSHATTQRSSLVNGAAASCGRKAASTRSPSNSTSTSPL